MQPIETQTGLSVGDLADLRTRTPMQMETFLDTYGLAAACAVMLVKAIGVPIPIPGDVILLATAARAAEGKLALWLAFSVLLIAIVAGGVLQFLLARGPARRLAMRYGARLGLSEARLEKVAVRMRQGGPLAIGLGVLTPGLRTAVIPACGLTGVPLGMFLLGLCIGSTVDLALHFVLGFAGSAVLTASPLVLVAALALVGSGAWLFIARRRHLSAAEGLTAWTQATCPVCLVVGDAVRWEGAA
jgi:membrane protein DedA with SNARE-associated domain